MIDSQLPLKIDYLDNSDVSNSSLEEQDLIQGLSQIPKTIPPRYFYDRLGSELFEEICQLPEYYPTRTEARILQQYAGEIRDITGACQLIELGSGSSTKTRILLNSYQALDGVEYVPIDVSRAMLAASIQQLQQEYPQLDIHGLAGTYTQAFDKLPASDLPARMIFFLGSSLGNFSAEECDRFIAQIHDALEIGDYFLLGIDLHKPKQILEAAYNDSQGVTARFNLNMLNHLNQRFQGDFKPELFEHWAFYNQKLNQIEMHLRCLESHTVALKTLNLEVALSQGETIRTEISRKFDLKQMQQQLKEKGLKSLAVWTDPKQWFGLILSQKSKSNLDLPGNA